MEWEGEEVGGDDAWDDGEGNAGCELGADAFWRDHGARVLQG